MIPSKPNSTQLAYYNVLPSAIACPTLQVFHEAVSCCVTRCHPRGRLPKVASLFRGLLAASYRKIT